MDINSIYVLSSICVAVASCGFTAGVLFSKFQTKERCEQYRQNCDEKRENEFLKVNESIKRIHERIDEILNKIIIR